MINHQTVDQGANAAWHATAATATSAGPPLWALVCDGHRLRGVWLATRPTGAVKQALKAEKKNGC